MALIMAVTGLVAEAAEPVTAAVFLACGLFLLLVEGRDANLDAVSRRLARGVGWVYLALAGLIGVLLAVGVVPWGLAPTG
ncbi:MAG TPA: hypothetical protein VIL38_05400 [Thermaerobacter sp.]